VEEVVNKDVLRDEIIRCGQDPAYFINNYVKIQHPVRGLIPFKMFDYQEQLIADYQKHRFNVVLKGRQIGISEVTAAYAAWLLLFHRNKNILVMATKADTAKNIIKKVRVAISKLPKWMIIADIITDNRLSVELSNGSQMKAISSSDDAGRSEALSLLIIDEAAFVKNLEELWTGLIPTVAAGGNIIVLSTPNGFGNQFHKIYSEAEQGLNEFHHTKLMWWVHPERIADLQDDPERPGFKTSSWYKAEIKRSNMSDRDVAQELECNFNASGQTFLTPEQIDELRNNTTNPVSIEWADRNMWIWHQPHPNSKYVICADVARGDGFDNSACVIYDISNMLQVAEYYGKVSVEEYANLLVEYGRKYNKALLVVENNNVGTACLEHIRLHNYENLYYSARGDSRPGTAVHSSWGPPSGDYVIGFTTQQKVRPLIFSKLEEYVRNKSFRIQSNRMVFEAKTFIWNGGKAQAAKGCNDDLMISHALACWIKDTFISPGEATANIQATLLENMKVFGHVNTDIIGASKQPEHVRMDQYQITTSRNTVPDRIRLPGGRVADFRWLYKG
jgi:hypothetical protein